MQEEKKILEILRDAGCEEAEVQAILTSYMNGSYKKAERLVAQCRKKQLDKLHESQACIDRLDYFSYRMIKELN